MEGVIASTRGPLNAPERVRPVPATFRVVTFGCKVSQYDSQSMRETLRGFLAEAPEGEDPDLVLVNTCSVTAEADREALRELRRMRARYPRARIVAAGCLARREDVDLAGQGLADAVVREAGPAALLAVIGITAASGAPRITRMDGRTRAFVKVQDGCDRRCAFCIVPLVRGRSVSRPAGEVAGEVRGLWDSGVPEVVLCGVELSAWRDPAGGARLADLVADLVREPGPGRLRLSSIYPGRRDDALLDLVTGHPRVCNHLHLPVQSGSDSVLRAMRRGYTREDVVGLVREVRRRDPRAGLTADVLAGFPGETDADAAATMELVAECGFHRLHLFPFSPRPGTPAAALDQLPAGTVAARMERLRELGGRLRDDALGREAGCEVEAVVEREGGDGSLRGTTRSYMPVRFRGPGARPGATVRLRVTGSAEGELSAVPVEGGA